MLRLFPLWEGGVRVEVVFDVGAFALDKVDRETLAVNPIGVSAQVRRQISERWIEDS